MTLGLSAAASLAALSLGLSAGALVAEGAVLVPFWRSLRPGEFLRWYQRYASLLVRFFGSLEIASTIFVLLAAVALGFSGSAGRVPMALSAALAIAVLASFPLYFQKANASFAEATIAEDAVAAELQRWSRWHWARTVVAVASFGAAVVAVAS